MRQTSKRIQFIKTRENVGETKRISFDVFTMPDDRMAGPHFERRLFLPS
jgi:hypothetical protein